MLDETLPRFDELLSQLGASPDQNKRLSGLMGHLQLQSGHVLFHQGETQEDLYIIERGFVDVVLEGVHGNRPLARLGPGHLVGEISFIGEGPTTATTVAVDEVTLASIDKACLSNLKANDPELLCMVIHAISKVLCHRLGRANTLLMGTTKVSAAA